MERQRAGFIFSASMWYAAFLTDAYMLQLHLDTPYSIRAPNEWTKPEKESNYITVRHPDEGPHVI